MTAEKPPQMQCKLFAKRKQDGGLRAAADNVLRGS